MKLQTLKPRLKTISTSRANPLPMLAETQRARGRTGVERRKRFLQEHPLCVECERQDRVSATTVADHRVPLWAGGADDLDANGNALCHEHHDAKTACEAGMRAAGGWMATACTCGQHGG